LCVSGYTSTYPFTMCLSLCIPRLSVSITEEYIRRTLNSLQWGIISHIYLIKSQSSQKAFIYFKQWDDRLMLEKFQENNHINIIHSFPSFWKCSINKNTFIHSF